MLPGDISRSHSVALYMTPPASSDTAVWIRISFVCLTTLLCVIVSLGCASHSYRSIHVSVFRLTGAHECLCVGGCDGGTATAILKCVKICLAKTTGTANICTHSLAANPFRASCCGTCQTPLC